MGNFITSNFHPMNSKPATAKEVFKNLAAKLERYQLTINQEKTLTILDIIINCADAISSIKVYKRRFMSMKIERRPIKRITRLSTKRDFAEILLKSYIQTNIIKRKPVFK